MGSAVNCTIRDNLILNRYYQKPYCKGGILDNKKLHDLSEDLCKNFDVKTPDSDYKLGTLSGGNMQKVIVAREFSAEPSILIADQPTRGVDVGAIEFIHKKIVEIRDRGCAVLLVSADLNEILELSDSIIVMCQGKISGYFPQAKEMTEEELGYYMLGVKHQSEEDLRRACCEE